ncbi:MAG TPA: hypothetical protein VJN94_09620 [Candidatus Binataceae bacterium]|nr:hypothetical protein [Candidatus Binataceae bacterium]
MAGDYSSRRFVKFWWVLAFLAGAALGAFSITVVGVSDTVWGLVGFGVPIAGMVAALEWFGSRGRGARSYQGPWRRMPRGNGPQLHKSAKARPTPRRGQLHAITGRKTAEPPSSGSS